MPPLCKPALPDAARQRPDQLIRLSSADAAHTSQEKDSKGDLSELKVVQTIRARLCLLQVYERMQEINAASAEARASKILHGLGFTEVMQKRATHLFSGGWRMRISLARALYIQPTVLLLVSS